MSYLGIHISISGLPTQSKKHFYFVTYYSSLQSTSAFARFGILKGNELLHNDVTSLMCAKNSGLNDYYLKRPVTVPAIPCTHQDI